MNESGTNDETTGYQWEPLAHQVPTQADFGKGLDEAHVWKQFGGMTLDEAYHQFLENPLCRQEDFMFMGSTAFLFYFPVIERYLYTVRAADAFDDCQASILSQAIILQLKSADLAANKQLITRVAKLVDHVLHNPNQYAQTTDEQEQVLSGWTDLRETIERIRK